MNTLEVHKILDRDIRLNYQSNAEFAREVGFTRQKLHQFMNVLVGNSPRNSINKLFSVLEKAGYTITIEKTSHCEDQ